jgi:hypothetical protein
MSLHGRIALVTGGGSGIGRATAIRLAEDGADGVVLDLNLDGARETRRGSPGIRHADEVGDGRPRPRRRGLDRLRHSGSRRTGPSFAGGPHHPARGHRSRHGPLDQPAAHTPADLGKLGAAPRDVPALGLGVRSGRAGPAHQSDPRPTPVLFPRLAGSSWAAPDRARGPGGGPPTRGIHRRLARGLRRLFRLVERLELGSAVPGADLADPLLGGGRVGGPGPGAGGSRRPWRHRQLERLLFDPVDFERWIRLDRGLTNNIATQFRFDASALVVGWVAPPGRMLDILWLRSLVPEQISRYGGLVAVTARDRGIDLGQLARLSGLFMVAAALGLMGLSASKVARLVRRSAGEPS